MIVGNMTRLTQNPNRALFCVSVHNEMCNTSIKPILKRSQSGAFSVYAAQPRGYYAPYAWLQPQKARDIASRYLTTGTVSASGQGEMGKNAVGSSTATISTEALGQLIAQAIGTTSATITTEALASAALYAEGVTGISISAQTLWKALGWLLANTTLELSGELQSYATGKLSGDATLCETGDITPKSISNAVWGVQTSDYQEAGSTGKALSSAGTAGDPWTADLTDGYIEGTAGNIVGKKLLKKGQFIALK